MKFSVTKLVNRVCSTLIPNSSSVTKTQLLFNQQDTFYTNLFSQLKSAPHLLEAKRLHAILICRGFFSPTCTDRVLASQLVNVYVNYGCLREAFLVFDRLPNKSNNIAWNAILRGFIDTGQFSEAIQFYYLLLRQRVVPDNFTYPLVLKACSGLNDLELGRRIQGHILLDEAHGNMKRNIYIECAMIDMFAKCGGLSEAKKVFEEMPKRDLVSWSAMLTGTVQNAEWFEALRLFKRMRSEGLFQPDSVIVATVLPACGRLEDKQMGRTLQGCVIRSGLECDLFVSNALIDMYCKCSDTYEAHRIFCGMVYKDVVTWTILIAGYSQNCQYHESFKMFLEMNSVDIRTNEIVVASVLPALGKLKLLKQGKEMHNYILKQGFESDVVVGSATIDMYANCGATREAKHVFEIMLDGGINIWNSMIVGYSSNGDLDSAFEVFRRMWDYNIRPNSITLMSIVPICVKVGSVRLGKEIHGYATRSGLGTVISVQNSTIDMYCKCGCLELGLKAFNKMREKNIVTYNTMISALGIHGCGNEAFTLFEEMKATRINPNKVTFVSLLSACSHSGVVDKGWFFYNAMINNYRILPDMEHFSCMADLLGRAGHLHDAYNFIRRMPVEPHIDVLGSLLGACKVHNNVELAALVGELILQKNEKDLGYHVLLSNIYAATDRWNDTQKVRTMIKMKGLMKEPGSSWIEIGSCIHMFLARDVIHPDFRNIQEILDVLLLDMKDEGYMTDSNIFFS